MRNDAREAPQESLTLAAAAARRAARRRGNQAESLAAARPSVLAAGAVDAALADDSLLCASAARQAGGERRDLAGDDDPERFLVDGPHASAGRDGAGDDLVRQMSRQLLLMQAQQEQLRRLLDLADQRRQPSSAPHAAP